MYSLSEGSLFANEVGQRYLLAMEEILDDNFGELARQTSSQKTYRNCISNVRNWNMNIFDKEFEKLKQSYSDLNDCLKHVFVQYVQDFQKSGLQIEIRIPDAKTVLQTFLQLAAAERDLQNADIFNHPEKRKCTAANIIRRTLHEFNNDVYVTAIQMDMIEESRDEERVGPDDSVSCLGDECRETIEEHGQTSVQSQDRYEGLHGARGDSEPCERPRDDRQENGQRDQLRDRLSNERHREERHREEWHRDDRHHDDRHREERHREERHHDDRHRDERHREERHREERHREERHREERHREERHREERHREERRDTLSELGSEHSKNGSERHQNYDRSMRRPTTERSVASSGSGTLDSFDVPDHRRARSDVGRRSHRQ